MLKKLKLEEILLIEIIFYFALWMYDEYLASVISLIFGVICLMILLTSLVVEKIEKSNVPKFFYKILTVSVIAPIVAVVIYSGIVGGIRWIMN